MKKNKLNLRNKIKVIKYFCMGLAIAMFYGWFVAEIFWKLFCN